MEYERVIEDRFSRINLARERGIVQCDDYKNGL